MRSKAFSGRGVRVLAGAVTAVAVSGAALVAAGPAVAADNPLPWLATETSTANGPAERVGDLSFYDASGNQIQSGTLDSHPIAAYFVAAGGHTPRTSDSSGATAYLAAPQVGVDPVSWGKDTVAATAPLSATQDASYTALPAAIRSSTRAVVPATSTDFSIDDFFTYDGYQNTYAAPNNNVYELRIVTGNPAEFYSADIEIDTANNAWTQIYPTVNSGPVSTAISAVTASPANPAPAGTTSVKLSATLSADDMTVPAGTVHLFDGSTDKGAAAVNATTGAITDTVTGLTNGSTHQYSFKFTPTDATAYDASQSAALTYSVKNPDATALTISKAATIAYGKTVTVSGTVKDTTTNKALGSATVSLYSKIGSAAYKKVKDVKSSTTGAISAAGLKPTRTTTYQWRYAATAAHKAATSATDTVTVNRTVTITRTAATIKKNATTKIWGGVAPIAGGTATLQRKSGAKWLTSLRATIKSQKLPNGHTAIGYVITWKGTITGKQTFRVVVSAVTGLGGATSATTTVTVK